MKIIAGLFTLALIATPLAFGCGSAEEPVTGADAPGLQTEGFVCPFICNDTPCRLSNGSCSIVCNGCFCAREGGTVDTTCAGGLTPGIISGDSILGDAGVPCGTTTCPVGERCCAACLSICVPPSGHCPEIPCNVP
jgi:hypothetical protein